MLKIHENAKLNFDQKGNELLTLVEEAPQEKSRSVFSPDVHVEHTITDKDIISFNPGTLVDGFGDEHGFFFAFNGKKYGIFNEKYKALLKLSESISKIQSINDKISQKTIKELIFEWINKKSSREISDSLTDYVLHEAAGKVELQEIWVPVRFLHIEVPFRVGRITFSPLTKAMIDGFESKWVSGSPDNEDKIRELFAKDVRKLQGHTAAILTIEAESTHAQEMVLEETKKSLLMLKLFSAAAFHPKLTSTYDIWGSEKIDRAKLLFITDGKLTSLSDQILDKQQPTENMDRECIKMHMDAGLNVLSDLLANNNKTSFQKNALDALFIYARCTTTKDPADKLLYVLVALESIFLRNNTEPIQQNLAERMAFLIEKNIQDRRKVITDVRCAYSIRSSFVHHGASIEDHEALEKFMWHAWRAITVIITATKTVKTKDELLDHLDELKLA